MQGSVRRIKITSDTHNNTRFCAQVIAEFDCHDTLWFFLNMRKSGRSVESANVYVEYAYIVQNNVRNLSQCVAFFSDILLEVK